MLDGDAHDSGNPALRYFLWDIGLGCKPKVLEEVEENSLFDSETDDGDPHRNPDVKEFGRT